MEQTPIAIDLLASSLDEACQDGHLPNPNIRIDAVANTNQANTRSYLLAIRSRLIDLGYLGDSTENRSRDFLDDRLKKAIRRFQKDAGLKTDAWVGPKTWSTLQQLVSFEDEQDPVNWNNPLLKDLSQRAVVRAVYLRLYALGFFLWSARLHRHTNLSIDSNIDFKNALKAFIKAAHRIGILKKKVAPKINMVTLRALFRQDELIHALNQHPEFIRAKKNKKLVSSVARIELWMLGFDVNVGNPRHRLIKRKGRLLRQQVTHLSLAMTEFWSQQPQVSRPTTKKAQQTVSPEFFRQLIEFEKDDHTPDEVVEDNLVSRINEFSSEERNELQSRLANIAGSIWDGVKRVFRWIKRFIKRLVSSALNVIKNIARFIAKHARTVFGTVKKAFEILYRGGVYLSQTLFPSSDPRHMAIYHDKDFDARIFTNLNANPDKLEQLMNVNRMESFCFGAACRILASLSDIIRTVVRTLLTGLAGWFVALLTLTKLAMRIKEINAEVEAVKTLEIGIETSPFLNQVD